MHDCLFLLLFLPVVVVAIVVRQSDGARTTPSVCTTHLCQHCSVRLADDFGDGPAEDSLAARFAVTKAPPSAPEWGKAEEDLVERGTGCSDRSAVAAALKTTSGNVDKARLHSLH